MKTILSLLLIMNFAVLAGQYDVPKFGKIEKSELELKSYDKDTSASALMIFDDGLSEFKISRDQTFQFVFRRHFKIKILKQSALDLADMEIRLYRNNDAKEKLSNIKAITYNLVDGQIVKTKFSEKDVLEAPAKFYVDHKCAFPEVKVGSVLEVSYEIVSDFLYDFRGWKFQYKFPALLSQYKCIIPIYFDYRTSSKGYLKFDINKTISSTASYDFETESSLDHLNEGKSSNASEAFRIETKNTMLAMKNVPAFISEPNIDNEDNYIQSIEFELSSVQYPGQMRKDYTSSWEAVNTQMMESEDFGKLLANNAFIKDTVNLICSDKKSEIDKAASIYRHVQNRMKWSERYSLWAPDKLKSPYNDRSGNSCEINLLLTVMLKTAGLKADPVLISTRDNGIANSLFPSINKYNSVISCVIIGGKRYLLDATSKSCPFGVLPSNDINGKGRLVNSLAGDWVDLEPNQKYTVNKKYNLEIAPDGIFKGYLAETYDGYAGISRRNAINSENTIDDYIRKLQESNTGLIINNHLFSDTKDINKPLYDSLSIEITDQAEIIGDKILFSPLLLESVIRNRYTLEDRQYPVNFNYPYSETYWFEYKIPEGYTVEFVPKSVSQRLPENAISINIILENTGDKIKVKYTRNINKMIFLPAEYRELKSIYDEIVKVHSEKIILKKA